MAVDVALHTADRETPKVIPADPMVGLVLVTRNGSRRGCCYRLFRVGAEI